VPGVIDPRLLLENGRENTAKAAFPPQYGGRLR